MCEYNLSELHNCIRQCQSSLDTIKKELNYLQNKVERVDNKGASNIREREAQFKSQVFLAHLRPIVHSLRVVRSYTEIEVYKELLSTIHSEIDRLS